MKLGNREFDTLLNGEPLSVLEARCLILDLISQIAPEVVADLLRRHNLSGDVENAIAKEIIQIIDLPLSLMLPKIGREESIVSVNRIDSLRLNERQLNAPLPHFCDLLIREGAKIDRRVQAHIRKRRPPLNDLASQREDARNTAIKAIVTKGAGWDRPSRNKVATSLISWGEKWDLTAPWCLDFGLDVLTEFIQELREVASDVSIYGYDSLNYSNTIKPRELFAWKSMIRHKKLETFFAASVDPLRFEFDFDGYRANYRAHRVG